jgi:hypothetical protein
MKNHPSLNQRRKKEMKNKKNHNHHETRKKQERKIKNMLVNETRVHKLLAISFYEAHLKEK